MDLYGSFEHSREIGMKTLEIDLVALLQDDRALTIMRLEDGWMVSFSTVAQDDKEIIFVPDKMIVTGEGLDQALSLLRQQQILEVSNGMHA